MNLSSIGGTLLLLGVGSFILNFFDYEFRLLMWIDHWGYTTGMFIRGGMVLVGLLLLLFSSKKTSES